MSKSEILAAINELQTHIDNYFLTINTTLHDFQTSMAYYTAKLRLQPISPPPFSSLLIPPTTAATPSSYPYLCPSPPPPPTTPALFSHHHISPSPSPPQRFSTTQLHLQPRHSHSAIFHLPHPSAQPSPPPPSMFFHSSPPLFSPPTPSVSVATHSSLPYSFPSPPQLPPVSPTAPTPSVLIGLSVQRITLFSLPSPVPIDSRAATLLSPLAAPPSLSRSASWLSLQPTPSTFSATPSSHPCSFPSPPPNSSSLTITALRRALPFPQPLAAPPALPRSTSIGDVIPVGGISSLQLSPVPYVAP